jgi:hypothetical protein
MMKSAEGRSCYDGPTAVLLHGIVHRSLGHVVDSLREKLLAPLARLGEVDIFFHSWDIPEITNPRAGEHGVAVDPGEVARWLPEAHGIFESQEEFDRTIDWDPLFVKNPMRFCTGDEAGARATLMNFRRALESQHRAWDFFTRMKTRSYARVIATRPDLKFLQELEIPEELALPELQDSPASHRLWVPRFHAWGGVNDRFALGREESIGIWSRRTAFVDGCLLNPGDSNPEWFLMKWLERNRIRPSLLDFVFQRVRANGEVTERDRNLTVAVSPPPRPPLPAAPRPGSNGHPSAGIRKERFLILARQACGASRRLEEILAPLGKTEVILDNPGEDESDGVWYSDEEVAGYGGLMSNSSPFPTLTAWSRAMFHLEKTLQPDEAVWFVEDDVAGNPEFFGALVRETASYGADLAALDIFSRDADPGWHLWNFAEPWFKQPWKAFKPLCRKSPRLISAALDFRRKHGRFAFHEVLFPSLASEAGMQCLDWNRHGDFRRLLPVFLFRPPLDRPVPGVCHPVKADHTHEAVCRHEGSPAARAAVPELPGMPRFPEAIFEPWNLQMDEYAWLVRHCRRNGIRAALEIGCGTSSLALLDAGCRVLSFESDPFWQAHTSRWFGDDRDLELRTPGEERICLAGDLPFRPELVLVNAARATGLGATNLRQACELGLMIAKEVIVHGTSDPQARELMSSLESSGHPARFLPSSRGIAILGSGSSSGFNNGPGVAASHYRGLKTAGWFVDEPETWEIHFGSDEPVKVLEIGASDGVSANLMLDLLFPNPASEVHCIDFYDPVPGRPEFAEQCRSDFEENALRGDHVSQLHLYEGHVGEILAVMISGEGFWESFDLVHLGGGMPAEQILTAACQAWYLAKPGAIFVFSSMGHGRNGPERAAWNAFRSVFHGSLQLLREGESMIVRKLHAAPSFTPSQRNALRQAVGPAKPTARRSETVCSD